MRAPPPIEVSCAPGHAWRTALSCLVGLSAAVPAAWGLAHAAAQWGDPSGSPLKAMGTPLVQVAVVLAVAVMMSGAFWWMNRRSGVGEHTLRWDGQDWVLAGSVGCPDRRGDAALMLDLGPWMLVRFDPAGAKGPRASSWLTLSAAADPARWPALRGALWNWRADAGDARP